MIKRAILILASVLMLTSTSFADWANYGRYASANQQVLESGKAPVAVFMGDSITDGWSNNASKEFFAENNYVGRGISGQVTAQMLARFRADVIDLKPKVVLIMAGTNDIARNQGPVELKNIAGNVISMAELARANRITPIICSITPASQYGWRKEIENVGDKIMEVNKMLKDYADSHRMMYLDYHTPLANEEKGLSKEHSGDGVHPNKACYIIMEKLAKEAIEKAEKESARRREAFGRRQRNQQQ